MGRSLTPQFGIEVASDEAIAIVTVHGEVDLATSDRLAEELRRVRSSGVEVIVDLERVEFMDCTGLRALLPPGALRGARPARFAVTPGPRQVRKLFELTGANRLVRIVSPATIRRAAA